MPDYNESFSDEYLQTKYAEVHYRLHAGSGKKIIFLHGLSGSTKVWARLVADLEDEIEVYLFDLIGHGKSSAPKEGYNIDMQVLMLEEAIRKLGISSPFIFGHSYGGWVSALYAVRNDEYTGLILEDSAGLEEYMTELASGRDPAANKEELVRAARILGSDKVVVDNFLESLRSADTLNSRSLAMIKKPTAVIWGSEDRRIPLAYGRLFSERIPESRLYIIQGAGHSPHYTNHSEVATVLSEFLSGVG
jgi:pimeloyl-ACP methyl ester carboxylesterase